MSHTQAYIFKVAIQLLTLVAASLANAPDGWEIGGGDIIALKFVKGARVLSQEIRGQSDCPLKKYLKPDQLERAIEKTLVQTTDQLNRVSSGNNAITFNRLTWFTLPRPQKLAAVADAYATQLGVTLPAAYDINKCFTSRLWGKVFGGRGVEDVPVATFTANEIRATIDDLVNHLGQKRASALRKAFNFEQFRKMAAKVNIEVAPLAMPYAGITLKDGIYEHHADGASITINAHLWSVLSQGQRLELLFHEVLGVSGFDDRHYQTSSRLFLALDERIFEI